MNILFLSSLLGWWNPWPTRICFQGGIWNQFCHVGTTPMRQRMSFREVEPETNRKTSFLSLLLAVGIREKKSDFANIGIRKTAGEINCYPKKWPWGHGTFANLSFHVSFGCRYLILLLHPGFWHSYDSVYTWIILFSQERSSKLLQKRLCPSKISLLIFCPCREWYIKHHLLIHKLLNIFDLTRALSIQCPVEKVYWVPSSPLRHKYLI